MTEIIDRTSNYSVSCIVESGYNDDTTLENERSDKGNSETEKCSKRRGKK